MSMDKDFALALIGGLLVLITGVVEFLYSISMVFWNLSYVGILFGFFMIIGALLMKYMPHGVNSKVVGIEKTSKFPLGGFICLICSLVSLTFLQGFLIGPMLGIVASTSSYSKIYRNK
jgi:peptidoglycan/LPS O-acetylase OafA/YrhL